METYLVEKTGDSITIGFKDASVELVRYNNTHPELEDRRLFVQVNDREPVKALDRASKAVADYYSDLKE